VHGVILPGASRTRRARKIAGGAIWRGERAAACFGICYCMQTGGDRAARQPAGIKDASDKRVRPAQIARLSA